MDQHQAKNTNLKAHKYQHDSWCNSKLGVQHVGIGKLHTALELDRNEDPSEVCAGVCADYVSQQKKLRLANPMCFLVYRADFRLPFLTD